MEIRAMTMEAYAEVYALWMACAGMGLNHLDDSYSGIERFLHRNPETCFVAVEGRKLVGVILAGHDGRRGYIYHTAVLPACRKQGIGKALVQAVVDALRNCEIHKVALVVFAKNEAGNAFWEQMGFSAREDLVYRNQTLAEMIRIDT